MTRRTVGKSSLLASLVLEDGDEIIEDGTVPSTEEELEAAAEEVEIGAEDVVSDAVETEDAIKAIDSTQAIADEVEEAAEGEEGISEQTAAIVQEALNFIWGPKFKIRDPESKKVLLLMPALETFSSANTRLAATQALHKNLTIVLEERDKSIMDTIKEWAKIFMDYFAKFFKTQRGLSLLAKKNSESAKEALADFSKDAELKGKKVTVKGLAQGAVKPTPTLQDVKRIQQKHDDLLNTFDVQVRKAIESVGVLFDFAKDADVGPPPADKIKKADDAFKSLTDALSNYSDQAKAGLWDGTTISVTTKEFKIPKTEITFGHRVSVDVVTGGQAEQINKNVQEVAPLNKNEIFEAYTLIENSQDWVKDVNNKLDKVTQLADDAAKILEESKNDDVKKLRVLLVDLLIAYKKVTPYVINLQFKTYHALLTWANASVAEAKSLASAKA